MEGFQRLLHSSGLKLCRAKLLVRNGQVALGLGVARIGHRELLTDLKPLLIRLQRLGRKSGQGFYQYDARGKRQTPTPEKIAADVPVTERLVLRLLNEAVACLREGVVADPDAVDAGMVYGTGFPPFRGGPFRYVDAVGAGRIVDELQALNDRFPGRFEPAAVLVEHARARKRFYPANGHPLP